MIDVQQRGLAPSNRTDMPSLMRPFTYWAVSVT